MLIRLVMVGALILSFGAGYFLALPQEDAAGVLQKELNDLRIENAALTASNTELAETLGLVRRQIQTDRIAYDNLKTTVDEAERQRALMQEKFESQRAVLERLKKQIQQLN